jgi:hypothetical protein
MRLQNVAPPSVLTTGADSFGVFFAGNLFIGVSSAVQQISADPPVL